MGYDETVQILFQLIDETKRSADAIQKNLKNIQQQADKGKSAFEKFAIAMVAINQGIGVLQKVGAAAKKAFEFAEQGAQIKQMEMSWDGLVKKLGVAPSILDDMSAASRRTISDFQLQASTTTLLAGANDELARAMLEASPQLVEIAKAANKLNPALGDTTFLYESIAKGIKRAQPLILDNLGITLKVGEAYDTFAANLGKTADELTTDQKAMAILNATVKQGNQIIQQAGGNVDAATDSYSQLKVIFEEVKQSLGELLDLALRPIAAGMVENIDRAERLKWAFDELGISQDILRHGSAALMNQYGAEGETLEEVEDKIIRNAEATAKHTKEMGEFYKSVYGVKEVLQDTAEEATDTALSLEDLGKRGHQAPLDIASGFHDMIVDMQAGGEEARTAIEGIYQAVLDGSISREDADRATAEIILSYEARKAEIEGRPFDFWETYQNIRDDIQVPFEDVEAIWKRIKDDTAKGIDATVRITYVESHVRASTSTASGAGAAAGAGSGAYEETRQGGGHVMPGMGYITHFSEGEAFRPNVAGNIVPNPGSFPVGGGGSSAKTSAQVAEQTQLLLQILDAIRSQGTARDTAQSMAEAAQFIS